MYKSGKVGKNFTIKHVSTEEAKQWEGWGTALKPAHEPIVVARKPLSEKTIAENVMKHGTGGLNIDASRVGTTGARNNGNSKGTGGYNTLGTFGKAERKNYNMGRFPANLIHDNSQMVLDCFPQTGKGSSKPRNRNTVGSFGMPNDTTPEYADDGSAARFFKSIIYQPKASKKDRGIGNSHATVKPTALMEYLITMVTKEGQTVLDPFMGSGTTGVSQSRSLSGTRIPVCNTGTLP